MNENMQSRCHRGELATKAKKKLQALSDLPTNLNIPSLLTLL